MVMVQAGPGTDAVIEQLAERFEPGDIIVDGGNANFHDTIRRERALRERGLNFVGAGISGGEERPSEGPRAWPAAPPRPTRPSAPSSPRSPPWRRANRASPTSAPTGGALRQDDPQRHRVRGHAAHRRVLRPASRVGGHEVNGIADVFATWNEGDLESYLIEITAEVLRQKDARTGRPLVDAKSPGRHGDPVEEAGVG